MTRSRITRALAALALAALMVAAPQSAHAKRIVGTNGPDRLVGTAKADTIKALGGADRVKGKAGRDRLKAGPGADRLNAVDGKRDRAVRGGSGRDACRIDAADLPRMRGCERRPGSMAEAPVKPRHPPGAQLRGDVPPVFSEPFYAITITLNASADGLSGNDLPISIEEVRATFPHHPLPTEAAQLVGGEGVANHRRRHQGVRRHRAGARGSRSYHGAGRRRQCDAGEAQTQAPLDSGSRTRTASQCPHSGSPEPTSPIEMLRGRCVMSPRVCGPDVVTGMASARAGPVMVDSEAELQSGLDGSETNRDRARCRHLPAGLQER